MNYICTTCKSEDEYQQRLADAQLDWASREREYEQRNDLPLTPWTWHNMGGGQVNTYDCRSPSRCLRGDR